MEHLLVCVKPWAQPPHSKHKEERSPRGMLLTNRSNQVLVNPTTFTTHSGDKEILKFPHDPERQAEILEKNRDVWSTHP